MRFSSIDGPGNKKGTTGMGAHCAFFFDPAIAGRETGRYYFCK
jgi:hypothetical protein